MPHISLTHVRGGWQRPLDDQSAIHVWSPDHRLLGTLPGALVVELVRGYVHGDRMRQAVIQALAGAKKPGAWVVPAPTRPLRVPAGRRAPRHPAEVILPGR